MPARPLRKPVLIVVATLLIVMSHLLSAGAAHASAAAQYTNPLAAQRADPHIFRHTDGKRKRRRAPGRGPVTCRLVGG
jgi:hypothetical protein